MQRLDETLQKTIIVHQQQLATNQLDSSNSTEFSYLFKMDLVSLIINDSVVLHLKLLL